MSSKPQSPSNFKLIYTLLFLISLFAIATPPAIAANILPDADFGAIAMVLSITILMAMLVVEIWRQTGKNADTSFQKHRNHSQMKQKT